MEILHPHGWAIVYTRIPKFMGPTWGPPGSCRPQMGPMLAPWTLLSGLFWVHYCDILWASWHLKSLATQLFVNSLFRLTSKNTSKVHITCPMWRESPQKWSVMWKLFHGMMSPWDQLTPFILFWRVGWKKMIRHNFHDYVIKWKHFLHYWPFVQGIHMSPVNSPHKGQWRRALMVSLICTRINAWVNNGEAGDLRRHYDVTVMSFVA